MPRDTHCSVCKICAKKQKTKKSLQPSHFLYYPSLSHRNPLLPVQNPLSWQVVSSSDGGRPIGPAVQRRPFDGEDVLGLKVRGGQVLPSDPRAALIELESAHIRPGNYSLARGEFFLSLDRWRHCRQPRLPLLAHRGEMAWRWIFVSLCVVFWTDFPLAKRFPWLANSCYTATLRVTAAQLMRFVKLFVWQLLYDEFIAALTLPLSTWEHSPWQVNSKTQRAVFCSSVPCFSCVVAIFDSFFCFVLSIWLRFGSIVVHSVPFPCACFRGRAYPFCLVSGAIRCHFASLINPNVPPFKLL